MVLDRRQRNLQTAGKKKKTHSRSLRSARRAGGRSGEGSMRSGSSAEEDEEEGG